MLNPLAIAHLGIARRPLVAALLGLWPDEYVPPAPVYVVPAGSGVPPVRAPLARRIRHVRGRAEGFGTSSAEAVPTLEVVRDVLANGHSVARVPVSMELVRKAEANGQTFASVRVRLLSVPVFSGDEMMALAAWRWRALH